MTNCSRNVALKILEIQPTASQKKRSRFSWDSGVSTAMEDHYTEISEGKDGRRRPIDPTLGCSSM